MDSSNPFSTITKWHDEPRSTGSAIIQFGQSMEAGSLFYVIRICVYVKRWHKCMIFIWAQRFFFKYQWVFMEQPGSFCTASSTRLSSKRFPKLLYYGTSKYIKNFGKKISKEKTTT
jgi:hypothetical protein